MIKKIVVIALLAIAMVSTLVACTTENETEQEHEAEQEGLMITTSFSVLGDIIQQVIGDRGHVDYMVPIGEEPHEYEPIPSDFQKLSDADVFYVNGMNLETWLEQIASNVTDTEIVTLSEGVNPINLRDSEEIDPHAWLSPKRIYIYLENLVQDLVERDPEGADNYRANAEQFLEELNALDQWIEEGIMGINENDRVIIVSENAFKYFGEDYGFATEGIWEINAHEQGTPQQIARLIDLVNDAALPAVFVESTVDARYMETVSNETGVPIAGEVFTDAIASDDSSYIEMIEANVSTFVEGLSR